MTVGAQKPVPTWADAPSLLQVAAMRFLLGVISHWVKHLQQLEI